MPSYSGAGGALLHYDDGTGFAGDHGDPGEGARPVVTLAGGAARHPAYLGDLAGIGTRHRLVVPHLRGVGESPAPAPGQERAGSYWRQGDDLERLRAHLGQERLLLVAHSAGTRLALGYAARNPHRLAGMVLVTPPSTYLVDEPSDVDRIVGERRGDPRFDAAAAAFEAGPDTSSDEAFNAWQQRVAPLGYGTWGPAEQAHSRCGRFDLAAAEAYFSVDPPEDLAARLGRVTAPVLVVAGAVDCLTGLAPVVALARLFPAGRCVVIEECGHYPWVEAPVEFAKVVQEFLDGIDSGPARPT